MLHAGISDANVELRVLGKYPFGVCFNLGASGLGAEEFN
jgi:hypothetical protein